MIDSKTKVSAEICRYNRLYWVIYIFFYADPIRMDS